VDLPGRALLVGSARVLPGVAEVGHADEQEDRCHQPNPPQVVDHIDHHFEHEIVLLSWLLFALWFRTTKLAIIKIIINLVARNHSRQDN